MNLRLGFSPCPNDTFIFDAMVHHKIDTEGLNFDLHIADVEELNRAAMAGEADITKLSYHAFAHLNQKYILLNAGSALGHNCGPLLISAQPILTEDVAPDMKIAIPGKLTTAHFLLSLAFPELTDKTEVLFSEIEHRLLSHEFDAGLIIHESRFTFEKLGLHKIIDLGEHWESTTGYPIPLGGIVINRRFDREVQEKIDRVMRRSVEYAFANREDVMPYVKQHSQSMEDDVVQSHINLYVNQFTVDLGPSGRAAVAYMMDKAVSLNLIGTVELPLFI